MLHPFLPSFLFSSAELGVESWAYCTLGKHWATFPSPFHSHLLIFFCPYLVWCTLRPTPHCQQNPLAGRCGDTCTQGAHPPVLFCAEGCLTSEQGSLPSRTAEPCSQPEAVVKGLHQGLLAAPGVWCDTWSRRAKRVQRMVHSQVGEGRGEMCEPSCSLPKLDTFLFFKFSRLFFFNYYYYYLLENITKTRHTEVEGNHLVMNTEVS